MDKQEAFDISLRELRKQGRISRDDREEARYRLVVDGKVVAKCSLGHLIEDEYYSPALENLNFNCYHVQAAVAHSTGMPMTPENRDFFRSLQAAHDMIADDPEMYFMGLERNFERLAETYNLKYEPPNN
jgi:hypothetical protein